MYDAFISSYAAYIILYDAYANLRDAYINFAFAYAMRFARKYNYAQDSDYPLSIVCLLFYGYFGIVRWDFTGEVLIPLRLAER